jgi:hypothetical protein
MILITSAVVMIAHFALSIGGFVATGLRVARRQ